MKTCSKCKESKPLSEFHRKSDARDGLYPLCKLCVKAKNAARVAADPEKNRRQVYEWNTKNIERRREIAREHYYKNTEKIKSRGAKWQKENPERVAAKAMAYEAAKLKAIPLWANLAKIAQIYKDAVKLANKNGIDYHVDHVVPLRGKTVCGLHCEANLTILEASKNRSKGNRHWPDMPE